MLLTRLVNESDSDWIHDNPLIRSKSGNGKFALLESESDLYGHPVQNRSDLFSFLLLRAKEKKRIRDYPKTIYTLLFPKFQIKYKTDRIG